MFAAALPFLGAAVGGAMSWLGSSESNRSNEYIGRQNNAFSAKQAQLNRDFQERMSNTSWQRGVGDMRAAGINPMLAVSQGGASSPSGNSAQGIAQANQQNEFAAIPGLVSTSLQAARLKTDMEKVMSDTALNKQLIATSKTQARLNESNANTSQASARVADANASNIRTLHAGLSQEEKIDKSTFGKVLRYLGRLNPFGHSAASILKAAK